MHHPATTRHAIARTPIAPTAGRRSPVVGHALKGAGATYGVFGLVLGLIAWIYLGAVTVLLCAELNLVRAGKFWPRSLMTPFSDDAELTAGDRRAYASYPATEQHKGFQNVEVDIDQPTAQQPPDPSTET